MSSHRSNVRGQAAAQTSSYWSYDARQTKVPVASRTRENVPKSARHHLPGANSTTVSRHEPVLSSSGPTSASGVSSSSGNGVRRGNVQVRPSIVPRSISGPSTARLDSQSPSRPQPLSSVPSNASRIPVLPRTSNENAPALDTTRKILRRKAPSVEQYVSSLARSTSYSKPRGDVTGNQSAKRSSKSLPGDIRDLATDIALDTALSAPKFPIMPASRRSDELPPALIPELKALAAASAPNRVASSTPHVPLVGSPSTQYSGSTGVWSSRNTTPSSVSSCSPGIIQASKIKPAHRLRKAIPPQNVTVKRPKLVLTGALAREAPASSASREKSSRDDKDKHDLLLQYRKQSRTSLTQATPTAPPRKSSMKPKSAQGAVISSDRPLGESFTEGLAGVTGVAGSFEGPALNLPKSAGESSLRERPRRPSRKGTEDLEMKLSPIVQSNLSARSVQDHRRRESLDMGNPGFSGQDEALPRSMDVVSQTDPVSHAEKMRHPFPREKMDAASGSSRLPVMRRIPDSSTREVSPNNSGRRQDPDELPQSTLGRLTSRLGIFGRRSKMGREDTSSTETRDLRKGPAAGTGHEGYGKYARRGRKYSKGSVNSSRDRSTSTNDNFRRPSLGRRNSQSSGGESEIDEFVAQRLQPVVIPGGGHLDDRPDSDAPTVWPSFHRASLGSDSTFDLSRHLTNDPAGSAISESPSISGTSIATDFPASITTHAERINPARLVSNQPYSLQAPASLDGYNTSQSSLDHEDMVVASAEQHPERPTPRDLKKAGKKGSRFRWNLFQRKTSTDHPVEEIEEQVVPSMRMSVAVAPVSVQKSLPYYAIIDSENDNDGDDGLQELLEQVYDSPSTSPEPYGLGLRQEYGHSVLLPAMPTLHGESLRDAPSSLPLLLRKRDSQPATAPLTDSPRSADNRRNRLPQIGRIPRVISRRDRQHKPAMTSFSRPFQREILGDAPEQSADDAAQRPILGIQTDVLPSRPFFSPGSGQPASAPAPSLATRPLGDFEPHSQFLIFPGEEPSGNFADNKPDEVNEAATNRPITRHRRHIEEDEIWNEYDDLLDRVMSPTSVESTQSAGLSLDQDLTPVSIDRMTEVQPKAHLNLGMLSKTGQSASQAQTPSLHLPLSSSFAKVDLEYRLRRSRIVSALQSPSPLSPASPFSITNYTMESTNHEVTNIDSGGVSRSATAVLASNPMSPSTRAPYAAFPSLPEASHHQSTALLDIAERDREGPAGQSDLRFAALMTSRWLSFGRVLFSPAHDVVENSPSQHVLVIDGLGNDDWSFYCAVTYPMAVIHDLKETDIAQGSRSDIPTESWRAPPNYRRAEIPNLAEQFPFPRSYFAAVVFRFPAAMSDNILKMAFSECKRVLMPGGYIELSLLDLDIVNMGTLTRRAVRDLKARMIGADLEVSLKPVSDNVQSILGRRGFENLNRCVVGVPVAGKVATSSGSRSSRSSRDSSNQRGKGIDQAGGESATLYGRSNHTDRARRREGNFSLSELVTDHSATSDEKITKMMAKVGRWWYTRTYEWAILQGGDLKKSVWSDKRMLHECKARGSGFKLLIAYAQKPMETRRRTMSEPVRSTAAIAGTRVMNRFDAGRRSEDTR